jgi:hypothetical protein
VKPKEIMAELQGYTWTDCTYRFFNGGGSRGRAYQHAARFRTHTFGTTAVRQLVNTLCFGEDFWTYANHFESGKAPTLPRCPKCWRLL